MTPFSEIKSLHTLLVKKIKQEKYDPRPNLTSLFLLAGGIEYLSLIEQASLCKKLTSVIKKHSSFRASQLHSWFYISGHFCI